MTMSDWYYKDANGHFVSKKPNMRERVYATKVFQKVLDIDGEKHRLTVTCEIHGFGDQDPYFSMTYDLSPWYRGKWDSERGSGGAGCKNYMEHLKEWGIDKHLKWHLTSAYGLPMHYIANGLFWAGHLGDYKDTPNWAHFESTIVYGAVETDGAFDYKRMTKDEMTEWLKFRQKALAQAMMQDMCELFGDDLYEGKDNTQRS
jgi:hypothetical protein